MKIPTYEQINAMAGEIWMNNGAVQNDPNTERWWLDAEAVCIELLNQHGDE